MTKKEIINLLEKQRNYYYELFSYYYEKELTAKNKKLEQEYRSLAVDNYAIYCILDSLYRQSKEK